ncbi:MAG TPA: hypothetical protein VFK16_07860 [Gemmatimonadaceae bacterium]|jgi:hypothetical protein|nr:hypothetical protein [Gemmatimonadaceae bacterium]
MKPSRETMQEHFTTLAPEAVMAQAQQFFSKRNPLYATNIDLSGPAWASFRGQGGEELVVAARAVPGGSHVTGSSYMFTMQLARFFTTLPELPRDGEGA